VWGECEQVRKTISRANSGSVWSMGRGRHEVGDVVVNRARNNT